MGREADFKDFSMSDPKAVMTSWGKKAQVQRMLGDGQVLSVTCAEFEMLLVP